MPTRVRAPDGTIAVFPDGMTDQQIADVMRREFQQAPKSAMDQGRAASPITGAVNTAIENVPGLDEFQAGFNTAINVPRNLIAGRTRINSPADALAAIQSQWNAERDYQRGSQETLSQQRPMVRDAANAVGMAASMLIPAGKAMQFTAGAPRALNMARGATVAAATGAGLGAAGRGDVQTRVQAAKDAAFNPLTLAMGAAGGALMPATPKPLRPQNPAQRNIQTLKDAGVFMTPGQQMGGVAKTTEDLAKRTPILGTAIRGAESRSVASLNRAVADRALEPVGAYLPKTVETGHDSVAHVAKTLGKVYDDAADLVPAAQIDQPFEASLQNISMILNEQPMTVREQFSAIVKNRLDHLRGKTVTGAQIRDAQSQIGQLASSFSASDDGAQRVLGGALDDVSDELANIIGRNSPEADQMIQSANQGWSIYTRMRNAAAKAKGGVFTPGQLSTAVRSLDRSVGKGNVAKGQAVLQDLSNAAWETMPDGYGNPGTADALLGFGGLGGLTAANPAAGVATVGGLAAAATPYFMMGKKIVERIPGNATPSQLQSVLSQLTALAAKDPAVLAMRAQVAAKLAALGGATGALSARQ